MPELHGCNGVKPYALAKSKGRTLDLVRSEHLLKLFWSNTFRREMRGVFFIELCKTERTERIGQPAKKSNFACAM